MKELATEGKLWMYESTNAKSGRMQNVKIWDSIWGGRAPIQPRTRSYPRL